MMYILQYFNVVIGTFSNTCSRLRG